MRGEYAEIEAESSKLLSYATPLMANVINPLIVAGGCWPGAGSGWPPACSGSCSSTPSPATAPPSSPRSPCSRSSCSSGGGSRPASVVVLLGVVVLTLGMWALDVLTGTLDFTSLLVRRFLITPGLLTGAYVWVFADIEKAHLAHSFLKPFLHYPYSREPPQLIGELFFGNASTNANANLLADGFANFGFPGMLLECLVLMVVLWFIDDACRGLSVRVAALAFVMPTLSLADSGLFTTLLTHGMGAATLACLLMPRTGMAAGPDQAADPGAPGALRRPTARSGTPTRENEQT